MRGNLSRRKMAALLAGAAAIGGVWAWRGRPEAAKPAPIRVAAATGYTGSIRSTARAGEAAAGWNLSASTRTAVAGALEAAGYSSRHAPDFLMLAFGYRADARQVLSTARRILGPRTKLFGIGSQRAEILDPGALSGAAVAGAGVLVQGVRSRRIQAGVAAAECAAYGSPREAARDATLRAIYDAGKLPGDRPRVVLLAPVRGGEEEVIAGVEDVLGRSVPILGGTAHGGAFVIGGDLASSQAVAIALLYTDLTVGWTFEAGYDVSLPLSGTVTRLEGRDLAEIDHRPAWDVYDEWLNGQLTAAVKTSPHEAGRVLALNPIYRQLRAPTGQLFAVFAHPWAYLREGRWRLRVGTEIRRGDRIYLSHGTWELLMNRVANLPRAAKARGGLPADEKPFFGIGFLCAGVAGVLPRDELAKMPLLFRYGMNGAPHLVAVTSGEQGFLPGIGNKHANLSTGFLVVRDTT